MRLLSDLWMSRAPMAALVVVGLGWASFSAQVPVLKAGLGASDALYGTLILLASLGALMAMWLAPLARRLFGAAALPVGAALMALGFLGAGLAPGPVGFTLALALAAAGSGIADVLANARVSELESDSRRSLMNLNHAVYSFGYAGAALATGWAREAGWSPEQIFAVLACGVAGLCLLMREPPRGAVASGPAPAASGLRPALVLTGGAVVMVAFMAEAATEGWSALHLERTLGGGASEGALGPALLGLTMGMGRLLGHGLTGRVAELPLMIGACLTGAAGMAVAGAAPGLATAYFGFGLGGLGISVVVPLALGMIGRNVPEALRLAAISRVSVLGYGAFFLGPPLMGFTAEIFGLRMSFVLIAVLLVLTALTLVPALARILRAPLAAASGAAAK